MVIQRIYIQPPPNDTQDAVVGANTSPLPSPASLRQRSGTLEVSDNKGGLAGKLEPLPPQGPTTNGAPLKRTPSTSTSKTVSRLLAQHTGGSMSSYSEYSSRPSSPLDGIRVPSNISVLRPSDFARRKAAFMKDSGPGKFHAELERRYANVPTPLDLKELPRDPDNAPRGTFLIPKLRSASAHTPSSTTTTKSEAKPADLLTPPRITSTSLTSSPDHSPVDNTNTPSSPSPKVELQVLELNKRLMDSTVENKTIAAEITSLENQVLTLQSKHMEAQTIVQTQEPAAPTPDPTENAVPKEQFDALVKDTEKAAKELEAIERKAEERQKELEALAAKAARLQTKQELAEAQVPDPHTVAAKETLEQAVERLREQVEVARRQSSEVVTRRMSNASRISERYAPSTTRVPLAWNRRTNGTAATDSNPPTPPVERLQFDDIVATRTVPVARRSSNRRSIISVVTAAEPLPERDDVQRSIRSYYSDASRPLSPPTLPTINHSDYDGPDRSLTQDMAAIMEGFSKETFNTDLLSLNTPPTLNNNTSKPAPKPSSPPPPPITPTSPTKVRNYAPSIRSKRSSSSIRGKKKGGWISLFKVKLPGSSSDDDRAHKAGNRPPVLAPITKTSPLSFNP